jgi:hypothetical protein
MNAPLRAPGAVWAPVILYLVAACGGGPAEPRKPTRLDVVSGNNQLGPVGEALSGTVVVRASDGQGPLGGVVVTAAVESGAGGSASPSSLTTDADGNAETTWTLGSRIGTQTLTLTTSGVPAAAVTATATAGNAALIFPVSAGFQLTVVGRAVTVIPRVQVTDLFGNAIAGVPVTFEPDAGGTVTGATPSTGSDGTAAVGSWTIGPDALAYVLSARIAGGAVATFQAQGIPATFVAAGGNGQSANTGTAVAAPPAVRAGRDDGSPLPGVLVSFAITGGGGIVQGGPVPTGGDGIARATRWILGTTPGPNAAEARIAGKEPIVFQATGVLAQPAASVAGSSTSQTGFFGNFVPEPPSLRVTDAQGNPVAGIPVIFATTQGDGVLTGPAPVTDFDGQARLGAWRLGNAPTHAVSATTGALPPVGFSVTASAPPPSTFTIDVRFVTTAPAVPPTPAQQTAFDQAAARWKEILISGDAPYPVNEQASFCYPAINETVPGVVIFAKLQAIDGVNGILGQAGPCIVRDDPGYLAAVGLMQFDIADLVGLESSGRLNAVILHEMGHVLGFGTLWNFLSNALLTGAGSSDPFFNGSSTRGAFLASVAAGSTFTGTPVPVENTGGGGTRDSHWREATVSNELMTGFLNQGVNPLSAFTAASFRDLGYVVNDAVSEQFTFQAFLQAVLQPSFRIVEGKLPGPILVIDRRGRVLRRVERQ